MRFLLDLFAGNVQLALAGYNAGEGAVRHRIAEVARLQADGHAEDVLAFFDQETDVGQDQADGALAPPPLEDGHDDPVGPPDRQQVHHHGLQRHEQAAEHEHEEQERQDEHRAHEDRQAVRGVGGEVVGHGVDRELHYWTGVIDHIAFLATEPDKVVKHLKALGVDLQGQIPAVLRLIEEARALAFDEAAAGISYHLNLDPKAAWVKVDRIQIQQVMINLVRNAVEAMAGCKPREVTIETRRAGQMIEIEVADTGPGIPPQNIESLFSEFMTTKSEGMGLGLPISRTIVEAHGGAIRAENRPEGGASFVFTPQRAKNRRL